MLLGLLEGHKEHIGRRGLDVADTLAEDRRPRRRPFPIRAEDLVARVPRMEVQRNLGSQSGWSCERLAALVEYAEQLAQLGANRLVRPQTLQRGVEMAEGSPCPPE